MLVFHCRQLTLVLYRDKDLDDATIFNFAIDDISVQAGPCGELEKDFSLVAHYHRFSGREQQHR